MGNDVERIFTELTFDILQRQELLLKKQKQDEVVKIKDKSKSKSKTSSSCGCA